MISFTELAAEGSKQAKFTTSVYDPLAYMRLDSAAQRALNVFPDVAGVGPDASGSAGRTSNFSLQALLSRGKTAMSKRLVKVWCLTVWCGTVWCLTARC